MADQMDMAQERQQEILERQIKNARVVRTGRNVFFCDDCGELIPNARRQLLPGVERCAPCQEIKELKEKHYNGGSV